MYLKRNNELEVLSLYTGGYKQRFYLREISKKSHLPLKTCQRTIEDLEERNILIGEIEGKNKYFSLNLENIHTKLILLSAEIYKTEIFLEKYPFFKPFLKSLECSTPLILFGSYAKFTADEDSDIDLLIVNKKDSNLPFHLLAPKIHKILLSKKAFSRAIKNGEDLIKEIEENHVILNDHSFYINALWNNGN